MKTSATGKAFEKSLELIFDKYRRQGIMKIHKVDPPVIHIRKGASMRVVEKENPFLDYIGVWGDRTVVLEAKSTETRRLGLCGTSGIKLKQYENLELWIRSGAVGGVLWHHNGEVALVRMHELARERQRGSKSLKFEDYHKAQQGIGFELWSIWKLLNEHCL